MTVAVGEVSLVSGDGACAAARRRRRPRGPAGLGVWSLPGSGRVRLFLSRYAGPRRGCPWRSGCRGSKGGFRCAGKLHRPGPRSGTRSCPQTRCQDPGWLTGRGVSPWCALSLCAWIICQPNHKAGRAGTDCVNSGIPVYRAGKSAGPRGGEYRNKVTSECRCADEPGTGWSSTLCMNSRERS